jgi:hypothetical protein
VGKIIQRVGGEDIPKFGGVRRECDAGAVPPNMFRDLVNARLRDAPGAPVVSRGGQSKYGGQAPGCVRGIFSPEYDFSTLQPCGGCPEVWESDASEVTLPSMYLSDDTAISQNTSPSLSYFNPNQDPKLRSIIPCPWDSATVAIYSADGITGYVLARTNGISPAIDAVLYSFKRGLDPIEVARLVGGGNAIAFAVGGALMFLGTDLYVALDAPTPANDVLVYKLVGSTLVLDDTVGIGAPWNSGGGLVVLGSDLYFGASSIAGTTNIRRRSAGVWSDVSPPASHSILFHSRLIPYSGAFYFTGMRFFPSGTQYIYKVVGTTHTFERTAAGSDVYGAMAAFNGFLWYVFFSSGVMYLGRFDGAVWNDTYHNLSADYPLNDFDAGVLDMIVFDGSLRLLVRSDTTDITHGQCRFNILSSQGTDLTLPFVDEGCRNKQHFNIGLVAQQQLLAVMT